MSKLNILHIVAGDLDGGAARGAYWLHQELLRQNVASKILIKSNSKVDDPNVVNILKGRKKKLENKIILKVENLLKMFYKHKTKNSFSTGITGFNIINHPLYEWADVIHLHWINRGFLSIKLLSKIQKPIVWTLRDMWPMTGGCHYSMNCNNYVNNCGNCFVLGSSNNSDLSSYILKRKLKYYPKHMKIVGISSWVSEVASKSKVFKGYDIRTIFNNVDCSIFFPIKKSIARKAFGLKTNKKIVLIGAYNINTFYKGFDKFLQSLSFLDKDQVFILFFGKIDKNILEGIGFEFKSLGFMHDNVSLRLLYSAADVFVAPSIMEAFGKTIAESMACGTPVVCFDATGPKDIVDHKVNGYRAKPFKSEDLGKGINWIINHENNKQLSIESRQKIIQNFDSSLVATQYIELYSNLT